MNRRRNPESGIGKVRGDLARMLHKGGLVRPAKRNAGRMSNGFTAGCRYPGGRQTGNGFSSLGDLTYEY
jgi:hypothetical protein